MATFVQKISIQAPVERAWAVLSDIERWPEWTASVRAVRPLGAGPAGPGARYRVEQPKLDPADFTITEWQPPHSFTWAMRATGVSAVAVHTLREQPGGCELELRLEFRGFLALLVPLTGGKLIREYMTMEAEGMKRRSERSG